MSMESRKGREDVIRCGIMLQVANVVLNAEIGGVSDSCRLASAQ